jgi:hypothetical protein
MTPGKGRAIGGPFLPAPECCRGVAPDNVNIFHLPLETCAIRLHLSTCETLSHNLETAMYSTTDTARPGGIRAAFRRAEAWLDARGKWAWIAAMVLGFVLFWPVGLALLAYMIWGKQMFSRSCGHSRHNDRHHDHAGHGPGQSWGRHGYRAAQATGNTAFDTYKAEALRRLEDEQEAFEAFLQRLRSSKDKSEFDAFMEDRARSNAAQDAVEAQSAAAGPISPAGPTSPAGPADARPGEY